MACHCPVNRSKSLILVGIILNILAIILLYVNSTVFLNINSDNSTSFYKVNENQTSYNCSKNILDLPLTNSICILTDTIYLQICHGVPLLTSCLLIEDIDFYTLCKHLPNYMHSARAVADLGNGPGH